MASEQQISEIISRAIRVKYSQVPDSYKELSNFNSEATEHIRKQVNILQKNISVLNAQGRSDNYIVKYIENYTKNNILSQKFLKGLGDDGITMTVQEVLEQLNLPADPAIINKLIPGYNLDLDDEIIPEVLKELQSKLTKLKSKGQRSRSGFDDSRVKTESLWYRTFLQMSLGILAKRIDASSQLKSYLSLNSDTKSAITNFSALQRISRVKSFDQESDSDKKESLTSLVLTLGLEQKGFLRKTKSMEVDISIHFTETVPVGQKTPIYEVELLGVDADSVFIPHKRFRKSDRDMLDLANDFAESFLVPMMTSLRNQDVFKQL